MITFSTNLGLYIIISYIINLTFLTECIKDDKPKNYKEYFKLIILFITSPITLLTILGLSISYIFKLYFENEKR